VLCEAIQSLLMSLFDGDSHFFRERIAIRAVRLEVVKMYEIEDFKREEGELSEMLLKLFQRWKSHVCGYLYDREKRRMNWVDEFCQDVRKGLLDLELQGRLSGPRVP